MGRAPSIAGRQQLDRIREQFEAQEAESKRKLDRLNGRIAELGEGKRAMWSVLGQPKAPPKAGEAVAAEQADAAQGAAPPAASDGVDDQALTRREAELNERGAALERAEAEVAVRQEAIAAAEDGVAKRENALNEREAEVATRESALREQEAQMTTLRGQLAEREAEIQRTANALSAREQTLAAADARPQEATRPPAEKAAPAPAAASNGDDAARFVRAPAEDKSEAAASMAAESEASKRAADAKKALDADSLRSKVRFDAAASKPTVAAGAPKPAVVKPEAAEAPRDIQCDCNAEWARSENLTASLVRQRSENPDEVFFPLPHQRTCELADIFSAPRRRDRGKGSGDWTPMSTEDVTRNLFVPPAAKDANLSSHAVLQLLGVDGEYMGEQMSLPALACGPGAPAKTILLGRSSSCDVTLSRDDQISRRHMQIEARDGKLMARDLGSTYGTRINGKALGAEAAELKPGDVLVLGASSFQLQALGK